MRRKIIGFHRDEDGHWVAELCCGHNQHMRHKPPFTLRPWVQQRQTREARIGTTINCPLCDDETRH